LDGFVEGRFVKERTPEWARRFSEGFCMNMGCWTMREEKRSLSRAWSDEEHVEYETTF
jgi:hypothetical protein